jgi:hypothetical protein
VGTAGRKPAIDDADGAARPLRGLLTRAQRLGANGPRGKLRDGAFDGVETLPETLFDGCGDRGGDAVGGRPRGARAARGSPARA